MIGAVLAAGLGTRLWPLTRLRPKPLVPIAGQPMIEFALHALDRAGVGAVGVNTWHLGAQLAEHLGGRPGLQIVRETSLQGTGGGLRGIAAQLPPETLVAINGDALFDFPLAPLVEAHRTLGAEATLVLIAPPPGATYGRVGIDPTGQLQRVAEIEGPEPDREDLRWGIFTGVQIVEPSLIAALPAAGACDVLRSAYRDRLIGGGRLCGIFVEGYWSDVGTPARYLEANRAVLEGRLRPPRPLVGRHPEGVRAEAPSLILAGARVEAGARVGPGTVIGPGAHVKASADLEGCVVWGGARVRGVHRQAVCYSPS